MCLASVSIPPKYFFIISLLFVSVLCFVYNDKGCRTPDRKVGSCIAARKCQSLANFLYRVRKPLSPYVKGRIRDYVCGYEKRETKICCPNVINMPFIKNVPPNKFTSGIKDKAHKHLHLLPRECGVYETQSDKLYMNNGEKSKLGQFPWMALLSYNTSKGPMFKCGGTIINDRYVLTAAHCIKNLNQPLLGVRVGEYDISTRIDCDILDENTCAPQVQDLKIEEIIPHPYFSLTEIDSRNPDGFRDIGLLRVSKIKFSDFVRPICLPTEETKTAKRITQLAILSGWGLTPTGFYNVMRRADVSILGREECGSYFKDRGVKISIKEICTRGTEMYSYRGDSGGPIQILARFNNALRSIQYGVVSIRESTNGFKEYPGISTRVYSYMEWILDNIRE